MNYTVTLQTVDGMSDQMQRFELANRLRKLAERVAWGDQWETLPEILRPDADAEARSTSR